MPSIVPLLLLLSLAFLADAAIIGNTTSAQKSISSFALPIPTGIAVLQNQTTLDEARTIVEENQASIASINAERRANLLRNANNFKTANPPTIIPYPTLDSSVIQAAALVAEADSRNGGDVNNGTAKEKRAGSAFWMENVVQNGYSPYVPSPGTYKVFRNIRSYGAKGDGVTDDTAAINLAISDQNRCGKACGTSSTLGAVIYFPSGTYLVSSSIIQYYYTQFVGDAINPPILKAASSFVGLGVISSDVYTGVKNADGSDGEWYINQSNFLRQIRNMVIDTTLIPATLGPAGLHWQVGQATSLQNIHFIQNNSPGNNHVGIFMENGSGGFLSDLVFTGGSIGLQCGNQQFTSRKLTFNGCDNAIQMIWNWGWVYKSLDIQNCGIGINITGGSGIGSVLVLDSTISATKSGVVVSLPSNPQNTTQISIDNVNFAGSPIAISDQSGKSLAAGGGTLSSWVMGRVYTYLDGSTGHWQTGALSPSPSKPSALLDGVKIFEKSKPQFEGTAASSFVNVKTLGAKGDGSTDDAQTLNTILAGNVGKIIFFPFGVYMVSDTVHIPVGSIVVGQAWSQIMGYGTKFSSELSPHVMVQVGSAGDVGTMSIQDMLFTVRGATAGAVLVEWNVKGSSPGAAAMWDSHFRVGGALGSKLQAIDCPTSSTTSCKSAALLFHLAKTSSAYIENVWAWTADHDLDIPAQSQINVFAARGMLIEGPGPNWLYGTGSEHCTLYQYQTSEASNIFMAQIQTETPYYQPAPAAPAPFASSIGLFPHDPTFSDCSSKNALTCAMAWAVRLVSSTNILIYGAGLYNFFQNYDQTCLTAENCQSRLFQTIDTGPLSVLNLVTKASYEMISPDTGTAVLSSANQLPPVFVAVIAAWMPLASHQGGLGVDQSVPHLSPSSASILPLTCTSLGPTATFTLTPACASEVAALPNNRGSQNVPPGPASCDSCDLLRRLTGTCCGIGGGMTNPIVIPAQTVVDIPIAVPVNNTPPFAFTDTSGVPHKPGDKIGDISGGVWLLPFFLIPLLWTILPVYVVPAILLPFIPLPVLPPLLAIPGPTSVSSDGTELCLADASPSIGNCQNGNYPVFNPFTLSIDCDISDLAEALAMRTPCQIEADENPAEATAAANAAMTCNWTEYESEYEDATCSATTTKREEMEAGLRVGLEDELSFHEPLQKRSRAAISKTNGCQWTTQVLDGSTFPFVQPGICDATYICRGDDAHYPNVCANMASAISMRNKPSIFTVPRVGPGGSADRVNQKWYNGHVSSKNAQYGGWSILGCEVDEFPFASLRTGDTDPTLRLVEGGENGRAGNNWQSFRSAVIRWYRPGRAKSGNVRARTAGPGAGTEIRGPAGNLIICFRTLDTKGANDEWGLNIAGTSTNICQQPYGVGFVLTHDDPWWNYGTGASQRLTFTNSAGLLETAAPLYCTWPAPGRLEVDLSPNNNVQIISANLAYPSANPRWPQFTSGDNTYLCQSAASCAPFPNAVTRVGQQNYYSRKSFWSPGLPGFPQAGNSGLPVTFPPQIVASCQLKGNNIGKREELDTDMDVESQIPAQTALPGSLSTPNGTKELTSPESYALEKTQVSHMELAKRTDGFVKSNYDALMSKRNVNVTLIQEMKRAGAFGSYIDVGFYSIYPSCDINLSWADPCVLGDDSCPSGPDDTGVGNVAFQDSSSPSIPSLSPYIYQGCWTDGSVRTLPSDSSYSTTMTVETCRDYCNSKGYTSFGVEYITQCYCSNSISTLGGAKKTTDSECNLACGGDKSEYCGAAYRISIWSSPNPQTVAGFTSQGCYTDSGSSRALNRYKLYSPTMTISHCSEVCVSLGFSGFGLENGFECYCGNVLGGGAIRADQSKCNVDCGGQAGTKCGGAYYIDVFAKSGFGNNPTPTVGVVLMQVAESACNLVAPIVCNELDFWTFRDLTPVTYDLCRLISENANDKSSLGEYAYPGGAWVLPGSMLQGTLSSCTFSATDTKPTATATLTCPQVPSPIICTPATTTNGKGCPLGYKFETRDLLNCMIF